MNHLELNQTFLTIINQDSVIVEPYIKREDMHICARKFKVCKNCKDKDFEVCAVTIHFNTKSACIIATYRAPSGNFDLFISKLDTILRKLYTVTIEYIICGDINIDYLVDSDRKSRLEALLKTYNLTSVVSFPFRTQKHSATAIHNIFINISNMGNYSVCAITLDNKFQTIFCICDEYVINLFVCIYEVRKWTQKRLFGSSFKIMLLYVILRNRLKYYTERWFKQKSKYYSLENNVFSRIILFRVNIYKVI
jgi:hypothetical protein